MKILYLGSPIYATYPLSALLQADHEIVGVVAQPAKPAGRGKQEKDPPVAQFAKEKGLYVMQPLSAKEAGFIDKIKELKPDLAITCAYGQILTDEFLAIPRFGTINIHPSKLPKYRGAIPVQNALLGGLSETSVSILFTVKKLDAGPIILQENFLIGPDETAEDLLHRLFRASGSLLNEAISKIKDKNFVPEPQNEDDKTVCRKILKTDGLINWQDSTKNIYNKFRAFYPWPGSFTYFNKTPIVIEEMQPSLFPAPLEGVGEFIYDRREKKLFAKTIDGQIEIKKLKPAGKKTLDAASFWNGIQNKKEQLKYEFTNS